MTNSILASLPLFQMFSWTLEKVPFLQVVYWILASLPVLSFIIGAFVPTGYKPRNINYRVAFGLFLLTVGVAATIGFLGTCIVYAAVSNN